MIDSKINQNLCQDHFENNYLYTNKCIFLLRDTWRKICPVLCDKLVVEDFVIHKERKITFPSIDMKKFINFLKNIYNLILNICIYIYIFVQCPKLVKLLLHWVIFVADVH